MEGGHVTECLASGFLGEDSVKQDQVTAEAAATQSWSLSDLFLAAVRHDSALSPVQLTAA